MTSTSATHIAYTPFHDASLPDDVAPPRAVTSPVSVLVIDDDRTLREGCATILQGEGCNVSSAARGAEAQDLLRQRSYDVVFIDLYMTGVPGMELLKAALERNREALVIMMTGNPSVESSLEALRCGAWDYLLKPFSATQLQVLLGRAQHVVRSARASRASSGAGAGHSDKVTLLGTAPAFRQAVALARKLAQTDASVMITGESGTGKEVFAQFIHRHSRRASRQLVPVNSAAMPESLLESEMFGHRKGAFTGADREKPGLLEIAHGGTLFLDELTAMSMPIQAKLLRVLQDGVVRRLGSEQQDAVVDVRFISATNADPMECVRKGTLREDLYYRLRVVPIRLPALRHRVEDIPLLAEHFLTHFWERHRRRGSRAPELLPETIECLKARPWRGNVRELQNVIEHVAVLAEPGQQLGPDDLPVSDDIGSIGSRFTAPVADIDEGYHLAKDRLVTDFERDYLTRLVTRAGGNMSKAARLAHMDRTTLYRLLEKHRVPREETSLDLP